MKVQKERFDIVKVIEENIVKIFMILVICKLFYIYNIYDIKIISSFLKVT